jgi:MFS family permease
MTLTEHAPPPLFGRPYTLATLGSTGLVFLAAFEALAVTTVMPVIADDLGGRALYSLAFAAPMAAGVVGMVAGGAYADRRGPGRPLLVAIAVFTAGLIVAGTAPSMTVFVGARFLQGLGAGALTVALYVLVARVYPQALHPRVFGLFAAAWVLPSMVGPPVAALVAQTWSWHWVFLGVVLLVVAATALVAPVVRATPAEHGPASPEAPRRIAAAVVVAGAVVVLGLRLPGPWSWAMAAVTLLVVLVSVRTLLPPGTYRARPGLPAAVLVTAAAGGTFFSTEVYLPWLLQDRYAVPAWLSGITLTAGAVAWALGSHVQGRTGRRYRHATIIRAGAVLVASGALVALLCAAFPLHPAVAAGGWFLAGAGMGLMYPRISTLVLAGSDQARQGFNTAAKSIADAVGGSAALAVSGLVFAGASFRGAFVLSVVLGAATVLAASRVERR